MAVIAHRASSCGCITHGGLLTTETTSRGDAPLGRLLAVGLLPAGLVAQGQLATGAGAPSFCRCV